MIPSTIAPATLIVVGLMGFVFGLIVKKKPTIVNLIVATVVVLAIKLVGYYLFVYAVVYYYINCFFYLSF